jgi:hypothetical protein
MQRLTDKSTLQTYFRNLDDYRFVIYKQPFRLVRSTKALKTLVGERVLALLYCLAGISAA